ncbi:hypothetical protein [Prevotella intermedia]|jgi:hypothetical protein|uniref:hypothetical protein n=1 Tax=Prevotella intermedia TaxID=28131 RepID=UPI0005EB8E2F|nr:hypothetical protein [Prevotella intermedia]
MEKRQDFKFVASISKCGYATKQDVINTLGRENRKKYGTESLRFREQTVTVDEIVDLIGDGYAFCATFDTNNGELMWKKQDDGSKKCICPVLKDGYMSMTVKRDEFFKGSQIVSIDIDDTQYTNVEDFIEQLTYIPTFAYTSYSDSPEKRKFRLCYVLDSPLNSIEEYKEVANTIHYTAEQDTNEPILDKCGKKASQYFNGTNRSAGAELYKYYVVYDRSDFPTIEQEQEDEDKYAKVKCEFDKDTVRDMEKLTYKKFMHYYSLKYQYFYQTQVDWQEGEKYRLVGDDFICLTFRWNGKEIVKFGDGEHRRRKLKTYACLRRLIKPSITPEELLFNLYVDRERFFDNSDAVLSIDVLKTKVNAAFSLTIDEIKAKYAKLLENNKRKIVFNPTYLKDNAKLNKLGVGENVESLIRSAVKDYNYCEIDKYYNQKLSVMDNVKELAKNGISVSRRTLYRYCADRDIKVCYSDSEIIAMINANDSVRGNLATLKNNGVKIGKDRVAKLIKQLKEGGAKANDTSIASEVINVARDAKETKEMGGSNSQKVTDTEYLSSYKTTILYSNGTIRTPTNQPSNTPTQNDIIDEMEAYLLELENETINELLNNNSDNEKDIVPSLKGL